MLYQPFALLQNYLTDAFVLKCSFSMFFYSLQLEILKSFYENVTVVPHAGLF